MTDKAESKNNWLIVAIWAAALLVVFVAFRYDDLLKLPTLVGNLGGGPLVGGDIVASLAGLAIATLIAVAWFGYGSFVYRYFQSESTGNDSLAFQIARNSAIGAALTSLVWFILGYVGLYSTTASIVVVLIGAIEGVLNLIRSFSGRDADDSDRKESVGKVALLLLSIPVAIAAVASLAPPIAKDTLLYHFSLPKQFVAQGHLGFVEGNMASYLSLGTEMHAVWAMLLGGTISTRAAETAAGAVMFLFFPLLLAAVYGFARERGISRIWSLAATLMVACVPTAYHVASSGYVDLALSLFILLATSSLLKWFATSDRRPLILTGIFLGAALSIKLTTVFVIAAFALIVLLRARKANEEQAGSLRSGSAGKIVLSGFGALLLAGVIASPWYIRTWVETGSPVFPFYMSIWKGDAPGWDVERSNLFQTMNSQYGGGQQDPTNYLMSPARVSLAAQPEDPSLYDGVLGAMFLIGLPLVLWAAWKRELDDGIGYLLIIAGVVYLFWLFSSAQLRYLLPIVPLLSIAIASAADRLKDTAMRNAWRYSIVAGSVVAMLTSVAWFAMKAPLRVALGGETRDQYLTRNLDYYPYYAWLNTESQPDEKTWLINMRRDTYHIDRPVFSDYIFEDHTLRHLVWESRNVAELREKARGLGITYILARHDFLLDPDKTTLYDEKRSKTENEAKLRMTRELLIDPAATVRSDKRFSLVRIN